jgi:hypothetical protein
VREVERDEGKGVSYRWEREEERIADRGDGV